MVTLVVHGHVHVDDHALLKDRAVGDAVADYLVDAGAAAGGSRIELTASTETKKSGMVKGQQ